MTKFTTLLLMLFTATMYMNCTDFEALGSKSDDLESENCQSIYVDAYEATYYTELNINTCTTCHAGGTGTIQILGSDVNESYLELFDSDQISNVSDITAAFRADINGTSTWGHPISIPGFDQIVLDNFETIWQQATTDHSTCLANLNSN